MQQSNQSLALHQYLSGIITNIPYGVLTISKNLEISMINSNMLDILEVKKKDLNEYLDNNYEKLFVALPEIIDIYQKKFILENQLELDIEKFPYKNKMLDIKIRAMVEGTLVIIEDITQRINQQNRLEELNKTLENRIQKEVEKNRYQDQQMQQQSRLAQMGEMISMIAHQWRQPLGAIASTAANLSMKVELEYYDLDQKSSQEECQNYFLEQFRIIEDLVQNLTNTIDDFRNFYKPNKKSIFCTYETVVEKSLNIILASLRNDNIQIDYDYRSLEKIQMYDSEIMQVILNILKNAQDNFREHSIENPRITISTKNKTLSICDNGGGIPQNIMKKIFDPYFSTKSEKNGTGLGLYMSKIIVEEHHNGKFIAKNTDDGVCFMIDLRGGA
ncbi:HAMP domain-containing sensor histidine kinase [Sulfurimonas sp. NWX79]|uniref:HAMP domain-containing sensor histidine kinase n=1 Tax=Sulfurimonas sp. NWX79 TaxID=2925412 RepID=UPI003204F884